MSSLEGVVIARFDHEAAEACETTEAEVWRGGATRGPTQGRALVAPHATMAPHLAEQRRRGA
jgi:hypothetical protein